MSQSCLQHRDIVFHPFPPEQTVQAARFLNSMAGVEAQVFLAENRLVVSYDMRDYSLRELETRLSDAGFHIENTLLHKIKRALIYYCEEIEQYNRSMPVKNTKANNTAPIYVKIYDEHLHGDHDDTPEELRRDF